jgi:hypothetical protein
VQPPLAVTNWLPWTFNWTGAAQTEGQRHINITNIDIFNNDFKTFPLAKRVSAHLMVASDTAMLFVSISNLRLPGNIDFCS